MIAVDKLDFLHKLDFSNLPVKQFYSTLPSPTVPPNIDANNRGGNSAIGQIELGL